MKSNILKSLSLLLLMATTFVGCSDPEGTLYSNDSPIYAFAGATQKVEMLASDGNKIIVPVYRGTTQGSSTLDLIFIPAKGAEDMFKLETPTVSFEDGKSIGEAVITYEDINQLGVTDLYELTLSFDEANASPTNVSSITVKAQRKLTFNLIGTGIYTSSLFGQSWSQDIEKAEEANVYRLPDCYTEGFPITFSVDANGNIDNVSVQETGYKDKDYGMTYLCCTGAEKTGNTYKMNIYLAVDYNGELTQFTNIAIESIEFPE